MGRFPARRPGSPHAARPPVFEALESREVLAADLAIQAGPVTNPFDTRAKSDMVRIDVLVQNKGDTTYEGGTMGLFLSPNDTLGDDDELFANVRVPRLTPGASTTIKVNVREPKPVLPPEPSRALFAGEYRVIALLPPGDDEASRADNVSVAAGTVDVDYSFGSVNGRERVPLTVTLNDGSTLTFSLDGPGTGTLALDSGKLAVTVTTPSFHSSLFIRNADRRSVAAIGGITVNGVLKRIVADNVGISGFLNVNGGVAYIKVAGLFQSSLRITQDAAGAFFTPAAELHLGEVTNSVVRSDAPIQRLSVTRWLDTDAGPDSFIAPSILGISSKGDFQPSVELFAAGQGGRSLGTASIAGSLSGRWATAFGVESIRAGSTTADFHASIGGALTRLDVSGDLQGTLAFSTSTRITVGGNIIGATILAGASLGQDALLGGSGSNVDAFRAGFIGKIVVRGGAFSSLIATGLTTSDSILLDDDDRFVAAGQSFIGSIEIRREATGTRFVSPTPPATVRIATAKLQTADLDSFIRALGPA